MTTDTVPDFPIKCLECGRHERWSKFKDSCENPNCKITMARKNPKPQAILLMSEQPRHHKKCKCDRCIEEGATKIGAALLEASRAAAAKPAGGPTQAKIKVTHSEMEIISYYDEKEPTVYVECPPVICISVQPKGKKK